MRAARVRLAGAENFHSLESVAAGWLPSELRRELAARPGKRRRWLPLPLVCWACLNLVLHPGSSGRETPRSIQARWPRRGLVVAGTSVTAPDTHDNQQQWPQPGRQKPGGGWPLINLAGLFCRSRGALLRAAHGPWKTSAARLFALLRRTLRAGDSRVAARGFWSYA